MKKRRRLTLVLLFLSVSTAYAGPPKTCGEFAPVEFAPATITSKNADGSESKDYPIRQAEVDSYRLDAGDTPSVIFNKTTGKSCTAETAIVSGDNGDVYWLKQAKRVLYRSYSGSQQWVALVDPNGCKVLWKSPAHIGNLVKPTSVEIKPDCGVCEETGKFDTVCECRSAEVWKLTSACVLKRDEAASKRLTKELLHVAFVGLRKVTGAKSASAKLVP